jgi:hypothetical protein
LSAKAWLEKLSLVKEARAAVAVGAMQRNTLTHIAEDLTLTPAQEFREARDWLKQHKRDSFLWLVIVMTLTVFTLNFVAF